ncbi:MAG: hypothetical protein KGI82_01360 [Betaproteobacteria bacterium]|nr:hypothetical protein [Betaproteobacteria bacterium]
MSTKRALQTEILQYRNAEQLFRLGARVPIVAEMTHLSSWFLRKLSLEIRGEAPRKGQIPNSDQWYLRRQNHLQASLFCAIYDSVKRVACDEADECALLVSAYSELGRALEAAGITLLMSVDRAWWLLKSLQIRNLQRARCRACGARYLQPWGKLERNFLCGDCRSRGYTLAGGRSPRQVARGAGHERA